MKKAVIVILCLSVIFTLASCSDYARLSEEEAQEVIEVLSDVSSDTFYSDPSRAITASFSGNDGADGTVIMTYTADAVQGAEGITGAEGGFNAEFTDFVYTYYDEDENETDCTLNGTVYIQYTVGEETPDTGYLYAYGYEFLIFTDTDDTLSISGGTIDTPLSINVINSVTYQIGIDGGLSYRMDYSYTGEVNGRTFTDEEGYLEYTLSVLPD
ncbi:MAG: hypothetical protein PQJ61_15125 [Spirochaetales bacterium]|uniref:Uncharacterized protein n=1 Tax=Candidatus Thalassospirochaeta sargassi TaxID=3119039 RepID=A0AAJ1MPM8_9SPIO|nr:hypothetical protein [Spirochaetales bacterium]